MSPGPSRSPDGVLLVGTFPPPGSGAFSPCAGLAERLAAGGWRVLATSRARARLARLVEMTTTAWRRRDEYEVAQVDVFSGAAFLWAEAVCATLRAAKKPYVLTLHGGSLPEFAARRPARVARLLGSAHLVTTPSRYLLGALRPLRADIRLVPNAVPLDAFAFRLRGPVAPRLVWVRSFHRLYDPALAVEVLARLVAEGRDATLTMVGRDKDGSLGEVRRLARERGVADRLELPGGVPNGAVAAWLAKGDVFLNTTTVDNTPVSVLEAMASGLPVVSTNVGGIPHLLEDGRDALLVPPRDPEAMTAAVRRLVDDAALAERLSRAGYEAVRGFDWSAVLPVWREILGDAAAAGVAGATSGRRAA